MIKVIYKSDALSRESKIYQAKTIGEWLTQHYEKMPEHLSIFHTFSNADYAEISFANEVTPHTSVDLKCLDLMPGTFILIENPKAPAIWIPLVISLVIGVATYFLMPTPSVAATNANNQNAASPNNELSSRQNQTRINQRKPDIFGEAWSTPDLLAVPYTVYENNVEVEYLTAFITRGYCEIKEAYDGDTRIRDIAGATVQVYRPGVNIVSGNPYYRVGSRITAEPLGVQKQTSVNGQVLRPSNIETITGDSNIGFSSPNEIVLAPNTQLDFTDSFSSNDTIEITNASFNIETVENGATVTTPYNLAGTYPVLSVSNDRITLSNPSAINPAWDQLDNLENGTSPYISPTIKSVSEKWIGPFILDNLDRNMIVSNFVATNGLYLTNGNFQSPVNVTVEVEVTPVDENDQDIGYPILKSVVLKGSATARETVGMTLSISTFQGRCKVRARRVNETNKDFQGTVVDDVKWFALYGAHPLKRSVYENGTVVRARTYATAGALSVKERKLNLLVQRELPTYENGAMTTARQATSSFADALVSLATDPKIGRMSLDNLDLDNIYETYHDIVDYFGTPLAAEFCTTLDDSNVSFEEIAKMIEDSCFLTIYRQGTKLRVFFEKPSDNSSLLFNFRNIIPKTFEPSRNFGITDDFDGIVYEWTDPADNGRINIYLPDQNVMNPKEIKSVGVRNKWQAHFNAHRLYNKLVYQTETLKFEAAPESELLILKEPVSCAKDMLKAKYQSGEVEHQDGLILELSHPVEMQPNINYVIYLQTVDGFVDMIMLDGVEDGYFVKLSRLPISPISTDPSNQVKATYTIIEQNNAGSLSYLVAERTPAGKNTNNVTLVNYSARYYQNDGDFKAEPPIDETPIYIRYDVLDVNLANLYRMQRGELPNTGDVYFEVSAGVFVSSSSAYRPELENVYRYKPPYAPGGGDTTTYFRTFPARNEIPAITVGEWPQNVNIYLTIKGDVVGRGGDGGLAQHSIGADTTDQSILPMVKQQRNGYRGAPAISNEHPNFNLIVDGGTVARGGTGGGASPAGYSTALNYAINGCCGGGGAPFGQALSGVYPELEYDSDKVYWKDMRVPNTAVAGKTSGGTGYSKGFDGSYGYSSGISGNGGAWAQQGTSSNNSTVSGAFQSYGAPEGQPGELADAITGVAPLSIQIINGGQVL